LDVLRQSSIDGRSGSTLPREKEPSVQLGVGRNTLWDALHVQKWFDAEGIPAVVTGAIFPGILFPSVAYDMSGTGRHAALEFLRR
jgi:hypothetical protein